MDVRVQELPPRRVAYMRYIGPYGAHGIPELWERLVTWMQAHGLDVATTTRLGVAHDDPAITQAEKCRYDACAVVRNDFQADRSVNVTTIPGGRFAIWPFSGTAHEIQGSWDRVFAGWLPHSGYQPDDRPCLEVYRGRAFDKTGIFRCDLCLPVRRSESARCPRDRPSRGWGPAGRGALTQRSAPARPTPTPPASRARRRRA
jgi:AraC family transcriptional regulator